MKRIFIMLLIACSAITTVSADPTANPQKKLMCKGMSTLYGSSGIYNAATSMAPLANLVPSPLMNLSLNPWAEGHEMMKFPKETFHSLWKKGKVK